MALPDGRRVVIADAPGHEQYTRNMAVAASTADVALLLVDAARGVTRQTYRHLTICALMGVHHVIIAVNKLDAVGFDHARFSRAGRRGGRCGGPAGLLPGDGHPGQRPGRGQRDDGLRAHRLVRTARPS